MIIVYFKLGEEVGIGHKLSSDNIFDFIKDQLYVFWELTPSDRDWKRLFNRFNFAHFDYCGTKFFTIEYRYLKEDGSEIEVVVREGLV